MFFEKSQGLRLIDVFILGPFMIWYALCTKSCMDTISFAALFTFGLLTILYNGYNYVANVFRGMPRLPI